jgi:threonine aldolase
MTWRRGVDILSFGATKGGAMNTEAIVLFDHTLAEQLSYRLRRAGQTWSKMRFAAVQLIAYVEDGLYLRLAARANALAMRLAAGLSAIPGISLLAPIEANLLFVTLPSVLIDALAAANIRFARRGDTLIRLVTRFDSRDEDIDFLLGILRDHRSVPS